MDWWGGLEAGGRGPALGWGGQSQETGEGLRRVVVLPPQFPTGQAAAVKSLSATAPRCRGDQATLLAEGG